MELCVDLLSQLPTRRFVRTLLEERAILIKARLSGLFRWVLCEVTGLCVCNVGLCANLSISFSVKSDLALGFHPFGMTKRHGLTGAHCTTQCRCHIPVLEHVLPKSGRAACVRAAAFEWSTSRSQDL